MDPQRIDWYSVLSGFGSKSMNEIGFIPFLGIMGISLLSSLVIALLYVRFFQPRSTGSLIYRAFPLLGISITAIFIAIQFSLPLSLGLLGALSIVRFRTPIKEPEEIGFIMLVVATSLCAATFNILFLCIILGVAVIALLIMRFGRPFLMVNDNSGVVILEIPAPLYHQRNRELFDTLSTHIPSGRLDSVAENDGQAVISYNFQKVKQSSLLDLKALVNDHYPSATLNIFYNNNQAL
ncbi:DUF4956 domain-containing protein [Desulfofustis limnaeus]|jgi:hypothetical protein|uniref:DUF4956 domain-containing protein n=1 Tax=Desulfofustis limnaeus TaxID=2740163 RepID=A0ABN6LZ13_9BACT|nr:DUF4956 domain-containing protein [Desulfofustis limnaeus]MDX9894075.1 DUF4956 domain-containing protein [Desulfofustis sp.]BDD85871.1 DUF4956 domain-containing protein [Desulfofustis limnaeus]